MSILSPSFKQKPRDPVAFQPAPTRFDSLAAPKDAAKAVYLLRDGITWSIFAALLALGLALFVHVLPPLFISLYVFGTLEPAAIGLELAMLVAAWALLRASAAARGASITLPVLGLRTITALAASVTLFAAIGHFAFFHDHTLSVDEFMTRFGAAILRRGDLLAHIPDKWRVFGSALQPTFTYFDFAPRYEFWGSPYRPVTAAIHVLFGLIPGGDRLTDPLLAGLSVFLIARIAKRLWPERPDAPVVAALLMALSTQLLFTGMTYFAMTAHLAFNLAWLLFFLRGRVAGHVAAALIGAFAVGLHQINFHPMFVIPFLIPVLFSRRWPLALFYAAIYAGALLFWLDWYQIALWWSAGFSQVQNSNGDSFLYHIWGLAEAPDFVRTLFMLTDYARFFSWQGLLLAPLVVVGLRYWHQAPTIVRQGAWGFLVGTLPFIFVFADQGNGWGYRYAHGLIGNVVLLGVFGWTQIVPRGGIVPRQTIAALAVLGFASVALIALRSIQVEANIRPNAAALRFIQSLDADVVVIDGDVWFGADLAQNDPYLRNRPKIMWLPNLKEAYQMEALCGLNVRYLTLKDFPGLMSTPKILQQPQADFPRQMAACPGS
jgi:hypothetical protein